MNNNTYPKWVGVILGFLLSGSAHYLAGNRMAAFKWYFGLALLGAAAMLIMALPGIMSFILSIAAMLSALALWIIMLRQSYRPVPRIGISGWIAVVALGILLNAGWRHGVRQIVHPFKVPSGSMIPAFMPGDHVMAERVTYRFAKPKRGDIIVLSASGINYPSIAPNTFLIRRIAGLPGETIRIVPPHLLVNGSAVTNPPIFAEISARANGFILSPGAGHPLSAPNNRISLNSNEYLILGDNTAISLDGRHYGPIREDQILGRVSRIYWPPSRIRK